MTYEFGDYKVISTRQSGGLFGWPNYKGELFYKDHKISDDANRNDDKAILIWATLNIADHKERLALLQRAASV